MVQSTATKFHGALTALATPFTKGGAFDHEKFAALIDWQIKAGIDGIVPVGTTGESPTLSHDEHNQVIEVAIKAAAGRVPVIAGTGSNNTAEALALTQHAKAAGADAALVVTPYYNKPTQAGLYAHFAAIAEAVDLPIVIYNIPGRSVVDMTPETMARLVHDFANIIGVKDATNDLNRPQAMRHLVGDKFIQLSAEDATFPAFLAQGGQGVISVVSNVMPKLTSQLCKAWRDQDMAGFCAARDRLFPISRAMFAFGAPTATVKYVLSEMGICQATLRLPLVELSAEEKKALAPVIAEAKADM